MTTNERIKFLREKHGFTQKEFGEKIGYKSRAAMCKIEAGERDINRDKIVLLANALDTTPAYLMGWEDDPSPKSADEQLLELIDLLSDEQKASLIEFIEQIVKK